MLEIENFNNIIIANWKLNGSIEFAKDYIKNIEFDRSKNVDNCLVVCPPIPYIYYLKTDKFYIGSQDCSSFKNGAYTGEVSSDILRDSGCKFSIIGHSERRSLFNETEDIISKKINNVINSNIIPIFCIGETLNQRKENLTKEILKDQILKSLPKNINQKNLIIAYEPIWSIGTGFIPDLEEICEVHTFIKKKHY